MKKEETNYWVYLFAAIFWILMIGSLLSGFITVIKYLF